MANIDLNNFAVVKFGNVDIERNYINDILHAIVAKLNSIEDKGNGSVPPPAQVSGPFVITTPYPIGQARVLAGQAGVVAVVDGGPGGQVAVSVVPGGISTEQLADVPVASGGELLAYGFDSKGRMDQSRAVSTDDLNEGVNNLYFSNSRAQVASAAPFFLEEEESFYVFTNKQVLYSMPIEFSSGAYIEIDGALVEC